MREYKHESYRLCFAKCEVYPGTHVTRIALKLMALTFVRTRELIEAKKAEFDLKRARWDIPAERMKMRTPHIVPLSTQSVELLVLLWELTGDSELVFPGERDRKKPMSNNIILKGLERMGCKGRMTGHGFRGQRPQSCTNRVIITSTSNFNWRILRGML